MTNQTHLIGDENSKQRPSLAELKAKGEAFSKRVELEAKRKALEEKRRFKENNKEEKGDPYAPIHEIMDKISKNQKKPSIKPDPKYSLEELLKGTSKLTSKKNELSYLDDKCAPIIYSNNISNYKIKKNKDFYLENKNPYSKYDQNDKSK